MRVFRAGLDDLQGLADLFDQYRQFYEQSPDVPACRDYLRDRLVNGESVIFAAETDTGMVGFTQLYPTFCSVALSPIIQLYDLYVAREARRKGVGRALMDRAALFAAETGASRLQLETAVDNAAAQSLYESLGWERDNAFYTYHLEK